MAGLRAPSRKWRKEEVEERMKANLALFKANYLLLLAGCMSMSIISNPFTMGVVLVCLATFAVLLGWKGPLEVLGRQLTPRDRMAVAGALSLFFLVVSGALAKLLLSFSFGLTGREAGFSRRLLVGVMPCLSVCLSVLSVCFFVVLQSHFAQMHAQPPVNVAHMALRRRMGLAPGKTRNEEISMSQSNRGKDVSMRMRFFF